MEENLVSTAFHIRGCRNFNDASCFANAAVIGLSFLPGPSLATIVTAAEFFL